MTNWRKGSALLLVGLMVMSGLVAFSAPVLADQDIRQDWLELVFNDMYQIEGEPSPYTEVVFDRQSTWNEFRPGEGDGARDWDTVPATANTLYVQVNVMDANCDDLYINITDAENPDWWDFDDNGDTTTPDAFPVQGYYSGVAPAPGAGIITASWNFDILVTDFVGYGDDTQVTCSYSYYDFAASERRTGSFEIYIYLSTLYDDSGSTEDHVATLPDLTENEPGDGDTFFEAGDDFVATTLTLPNHLGEAVSDIWVNLTAPADSGITLAAGGTAWFPGALAGGGSTQEFYYRTYVEAGTEPGVYTGSADVEYTTGAGLRVMEPAAPIDWRVDFSFRDMDPYTPETTDISWSPFQCIATDVVIVEDGTRQIDYVAEDEYTIPTIEQSTYTDRRIVVNVTIENNGNSDLFDVRFQIAPTGWDYFRNPLFFWADINGGAPTYDTISDTFDLDVGDSETFQLEMIVVNNIPIGEHRLPIMYDGFYFNDGSLGEATEFQSINGAGNLNVTFSIMVTDSVIACHVNGAVVTGGSGDKGNIVAETIQVTLMNDEGYSFIDIIVRANFTGTPWYMPVIGMSDPWVDANNANPAMPEPAWGALGNITPTFTVDTDPNMTPDRYPFQLEITAVIEETLEVVTVVIDYTQGCVIDYGGYGPNIFISAFTADDIVPGEMFNLALTLENVGDDTLRNVTVFIPVDGTDPALWDVEQEFKEQFNWTGVFDKWMDVGAGDVDGSVTVPEGMFYTVEQLDVDNIKEIYEINLYVDGIYSRPSARIAAIHINDLAPGAIIDVTFDMYTDKDMVNGKPYDFAVTISGIDSLGADQNFVRQITVLSSIPGASYNPVELDWFDAGIKALGLFLFFIIVLAILLFVYNMFKGDPYDEDEDDFDFEDDEPDFEPAPPPAPVEEVSEPPTEELVEP